MEHVRSTVFMGGECQEKSLTVELMVDGTKIRPGTKNRCSYGLWRAPWPNVLKLSPSMIFSSEGQFIKTKHSTACRATSSSFTFLPRGLVRILIYSTVPNVCSFLPSPLAYPIFLPTTELLTTVDPAKYFMNNCYQYLRVIGPHLHMC